MRQPMLSKVGVNMNFAVRGDKVSRVFSILNHEFRKLSLTVHLLTS